MSAILLRAMQKDQSGTITAVKTASYGSEAGSIARVLVGFEREVETDIGTVRYGAHPR